MGKSSLLNRLVGRKALAKVSSQPGKTANINFFDVDGITLVDLPGYGYAKVGKAERERWAGLIDGYYHQERSFNLVVSLVDIRHDAQKLDVQMLDFLRSEELPFVVALTKADKLKKSQLEATKQEFERICAPYGCKQVFLTSAENRYGMEDLRALLNESAQG